eukprot:10175578-Lingulodinium_polyedra.AAC.1
MWQHALRDKVAHNAHAASTTVVTDGTMIYEHVEHGLLRQAARRHGYPCRLLRMNIAMYGATRRCSIAGCFSEPARH